MRAIVVDKFGPPERLRVGEVGKPMPGPEEVMVVVHAAPINYVDLLIVGGSYQFLSPLPFISSASTKRAGSGPLKRSPFRWVGRERHSLQCATAALQAAPCYSSKPNFTLF